MFETLHRCESWGLDWDLVGTVLRVVLKDKRRKFCLEEFLSIHVKYRTLGLVNGSF